MKKKIIYNTIGLILSSILLASCGDDDSSTYTIKYDNSIFISEVQEELTAPWYGFGYNQWALAREADGNTFREWDEQTFSQTKERILAINPGLVRMPLLIEWFCYDTNHVGQYAWNSPQMTEFYKMMDFYKENDIDIMSGLWGGGSREFYQSDDFAKLQADLIHQLMIVKGYTNITVYTPSNEPLGVYGDDFSLWSTMITKLHTELINRGLPNNMLVGADSWGDWMWLPAQEHKDILVGYDFHHYLNNSPDDTYRKLYHKELEEDMVKFASLIRAKDATNKPILVTETAPIPASLIDWPNLSTTPTMLLQSSYEYGLNNWDYGIQLARSGISSGLAWALDGVDQGKNSGMWNMAGAYGGMTLRPWYYTWQLMCRYFPKGAKILKMEEPTMDKDLRILGAKIGQDDYSFVIVNHKTRATSPEVREVTLKVDAGSKKIYVYNYNRQQCGDGITLSLPYEVIESGNLSAGINIKVGLESGVLITTMAPMLK